MGLFSLLMRSLRVSRQRGDSPREATQACTLEVWPEKLHRGQHDTADSPLQVTMVSVRNGSRLEMTKRHPGRGMCRLWLNSGASDAAQRIAHDFPGFAHNCLQVRQALEAFSIDLVDVLGA